MTATTTVLVTCARGTVASSIVAGLEQRANVRIKAGSRSGEGAHGVALDYADADTFGPALAGVDAVFVLVPGGVVDGFAFAAPFVRVAAMKKVRIVLMTAMGIEHAPDSPYGQLEQLVTSSKAPYVILRPNWFADNFHTYWSHGVKTGVIAVPAADGASSFIDARDIAASAVAALTSSKFDNRAFTLTGPQAFTYAEAATLLGKHLDKAIRYEALLDEPFVAGMVGAGVPEDYARMLTSIFVPVRAGYTAAVTGDVETLTGKAPLTLDTYARDHLAQLRG